DWGDCREGLCTYCGDGNLDDGEACDPGPNGNWDFCSDTCEVEPGCGNGILESGETCEVGEGGDWGDCREGLCTYCGDGNLDDGEEICDGEDYCNDQCEYKEFENLVIDPHCVGVGRLTWSVHNPNPYSIPNVRVVLDGVLKFDGTFPASADISMGTTADGPAPHIIVVAWAVDGFATVTSREICEPPYIPPPQEIPVTGESYIIPVTGADLVGELIARQEMLLTIGAALLGTALLVGGRKKKK
ncbi:MAG: hypothetical protein J7L66_00705, partial [Anaerolineaceae bacterium]|nr:hypothetical protein [Anaerolineaceae bacterium]